MRAERGAGEQGEGDADREADPGLDQATARDQPRHLARPGAEGHPDPDLLRALGDRVRR